MATYLVTESKYFVDPHGSADFGGTRKFITEDPNYLEMVHENPRMYWDDENFVHEYDLRGSEDGYNSRVYRYSVEELTEEEAINARSIIQYYNAL